MSSGIDWLVIAVLLLGFGAWGFVALKAITDSRATLTTMALILIVMGIIAASALNEVGVRSPGAWAWFGTGIAMILVQRFRSDRGGGEA